ncbi:MAG: hypothetical protein RLZZ206_3314 [Cyanobacteriota bacterium]|jgi:vacuolar-type H+-ATPase subunit F/Vma7
MKFGLIYELNTFIFIHMKLQPLEAFLSCSFAERDQEVNKLVESVCNGLDINCINVKNGYKETPAEKAKNMIQEAPLFIAIAVKRNKEEDGSYTMPHSVHDEIAMAYANSKPMLILKEQCVSLKGFLGGYATYLEFERLSMNKPNFINQIVKSLYTLRLDPVVSHDVIPEQDATAFYQEFMNVHYELVEENQVYTWKYSIKRKLVFTTTFKSVIRNAAWTNAPPKSLPLDSRIEWYSNITNSSREFKHDFQVQRDDANCIETALTLSPPPEKGDFIEFVNRYKSRYLSAIFPPDDGEPPRYTIGDRQFNAFDGVVPIAPTRHMRALFRFPDSYKLNMDNIYPFVGSYSAGVDYQVNSEMGRVKIDKVNFGDGPQIEISVESPLLRHIYGIAWMFPLRELN